MTTKGSGALLHEPPVVTIGGKKYKLRRLGLIDIERMIGIVEKAVIVAGRQKIDMNKIDSTTGMQFLIDFMPYAFDEVIEFLAGVIGLKVGYSAKEAEKRRKKSKTDKDPNEGTIRDPNVFPLGSELKLINALSEHQDVLNFFAEGKRFKENKLVKKLIELSNTPSIESSTGTDGQTSTSPGDD